MINFFRKLRQELASQNNIAKYLRYAIGEILLVVIGILIALQVNNWNENRISGIQESMYLKRLLIENKEDLVTFKSNISDLSKGIQTIEAFSSALKNSDLPDSLLILSANNYFKYGSIYPIFTSSTSTFDDLSSTGNLKIIRNTLLRDKLVKHYAKHKQVAERIRIGKEWALPVDAPFTYEHNIMRFDPFSAFLFPAESESVLAKELRTNKIDYINNTAAHFWIDNDAIMYLKILVQETEDIVALLEKELNN